MIHNLTKCKLKYALKERKKTITTLCIHPKKNRCKELQIMEHEPNTTASSRVFMLKSD